MQYPAAVVIGAGPAGLTAAYELTKRAVRPFVFEKNNQVGGISRTETYKGYRFDIGGHRFFTKVGEVEALWHEILESDLLCVPRLSRIYYEGKFYPYPLQLWPTFRNLGPIESTRIMASYLWTKVSRPFPVAQNLEEWVTNRFGPRLYRTFFKTYTEKVWGIPCTQIRADWAAQRIKTLSLKRAVVHALLGNGRESTLIDAFLYPVLGPGMMWERCAERIEAGGGAVRLGAEVVTLRHDTRRIREVEVRTPTGIKSFAPEQIISSMPINLLVQRLAPPPPEPVRKAADALKHRDFIVVALIIDRASLFPDNWIYVHSPEVQVGRIQNFKNWSPAMVPDVSKTCLGLEYFCSRGDGLWEQTDDALKDLATRELEWIGLARRAEIEDGTVIRQPMAYPIYDGTYRQHLKAIRHYLSGFENLQTVGRAGMHRYNNQDHSMLTALLAARNICGEQHDLWNVNVERSYHESFSVAEEKAYEVQTAA